MTRSKSNRARAYLPAVISAFARSNTSGAVPPASSSVGTICAVVVTGVPAGRALVVGGQRRGGRLLRTAARGDEEREEGGDQRSHHGRLHGERNAPTRGGAEFPHGRALVGRPGAQAPGSRIALLFGGPAERRGEEDSVYGRTEKDAAISRYISAARDEQALSREEEVELARKWRDTGDERAAEKLIRAN